MKWTLENFKQSGLINHFDAFFATHLQSDRPREIILVVLALLRQANGRGNIAISLDQLCQTEYQVEDETFIFDSPAPETVKKALLGSGLLGKPGQAGPLVLEEELLYLQRYHAYQSRLVDNINRRLIDPPVEVTLGQQAALSEWFTNPKAAGQREACLLALKHRFMILTGGPGTGKTTTAFKILHLLQLARVEAGLPALKMRLLAPTGKAAIRLTESVSSQTQRLPDDSALRTVLEVQAETIHRFLGFDPRNRTSFIHHQNHLVDCELILVDEASMIDLPLFCKLLEAIPQQAQLILMGDPNQLASVEAGSVLKDLVNFEGAPPAEPAQPQTPNNVGALVEHHAHLNESFRFGDQMGLVNLSGAVLSGHSSIQDYFDQTGLQHFEVNTPGELKNILIPQIKEIFSPLWSAPNAAEGLKRLGDQTILCAVRKGAFGVQGVNDLSVQIQQESTANTGCWPLMITKNNPALGLFNGDIGLAWPSESGTHAWFQVSGEPVSFPLGLLPQYEVAYGNTVHKSQGSEYQSVVLVLPPVMQEGLSRELLYTALTRSKVKFTFIGGMEVFQAAIGQQIRRKSGLSQSFRGREL